jgi:hypothetical protein
MAEKKIKITQNENDIVEAEILATAIRDLAAGVNKLFACGLNERAIVVLLNETSGVGRPDIRAVLNAMKNLQKDYCTR